MQKIKGLVYDECMPRKTLALIAGLVIVTVVLFIIALRTGQQQTVTQQTTQKQTMRPTPTPVAHTTLTLSPNPVEVSPGQQGTVDVMIDTSDNKVTAVQLELVYDPLVMSSIKVTPGVLFPNSIVLINKNDTTTGRMTYAFGIQPNQPTVSGKGSAATITFIARGTVGEQSSITLLPTTLVTAQGIVDSVLKASDGTVINIVTAGTNTPFVTTGPVQ